MSPSHMAELISTAFTRYPDGENASHSPALAYTPLPSLLLSPPQSPAPLKYSARTPCEKYCLTSAAAPATAGADMDVPPRESRAQVSSPDTEREALAEWTISPGATTSCA